MSGVWERIFHLADASTDDGFLKSLSLPETSPLCTEENAILREIEAKSKNLSWKRGSRRLKKGTFIFDSICHDLPSKTSTDSGVLSLTAFLTVPPPCLRGSWGSNTCLLWVSAGTSLGEQLHNLISQDLD
ncbi:hypothetical protein TNCT_416571 [Trichonephila clavata]|uniref:Uncharacterized protein n=1 Tax=Trichonephila clavata TaxID=2740835 RepID=A0A8X6KW57_TRICU|nr:hypothetical protein TNCT_416571 [Trichonephila clavata]